MFGWWPTKSRLRIEKLDEAYLRRMREVLENSTKPRHTGHVAGIAPPEPTPALTVEAQTGSPAG